MTIGTTGTSPIDIDRYSLLAQGTIYIPAAGTYTFGASTNNGFKLNLSNTSGWSYQNSSDTSVTNLLMRVTFPAAGDYSARWLGYEGTGSSWSELYAAPGSYTSLTGNAWRLVGDTANGGLSVTRRTASTSRSTNRRARSPT